jgi:lysophospholipase L1-like esterase
MPAPFLPVTLLAATKLAILAFCLVAFYPQALRAQETSAPSNNPAEKTPAGNKVAGNNVAGNNVAGEIPAEESTAEESTADEQLVAFNPHDPAAVEALLEPYRERSEKWQEDVAKLAGGNATDGGAEHVLFLGSSSFRLWDAIHEDLAPVKVVKRAYGGARFRDLAIYTPELIASLRFSKAVIFIANDITGKENEDTDPETTSKLARLVIAQLRSEHPEVPIHLVAVTPTPVRYKHWPRIQVTNRMLRKIAETTPGVYYIPTAYAFLDRDGHPRAELFKEDRLHLNSIGYQIWARILLGAFETADQESQKTQESR